MFFNDVVWNALKAKNGTNTTQATRLDHERAIAAAEQDRTISRTLQTLAQPLDTALGLLPRQPRAKWRVPWKKARACPCRSALTSTDCAMRCSS